MKYKYKLTDQWVATLARMEEFANGATQVSVTLNNGEVFHGLLISACQYPVAVRGHKDLPFDLAEIATIFQTEDDKNPKERGNWIYWDQWKT